MSAQIISGGAVRIRDNAVLVGAVQARGMVTCRFYGSGGLTKETGNMEEFRLLADGVEIFRLFPAVPNWCGDIPGKVMPWDIPAAVIQIPPGTQSVELWIRENAAGMPMHPGSLYGDYTAFGSGTSWFYELAFDDGVVLTGANVLNYAHTPYSGDPYWLPTGQLGIDALVCRRDW
jgi:hypothetical protein